MSPSSRLKLHPLDLAAPLAAVLLWTSTLVGWPTFWFAPLVFGVLAFALAIWRVRAGGRVVPAAVAAALVVMGLLLAYGVIAFLLVMGVGALAVYWLGGKLLRG